MRLYFHDKEGDLRGADTDWDLSDLDDQQTVKSQIERGTRIKPQGAILAIVE